MTLDMTNVRDSVRKVVDNYGSTAVITPITISKDKWGDKAEVDDTAVNTVGIGYDEFTSRYNFHKLGNLTEGDLILILKDDETIDTQSSSTIYKITYNSIDYDVVSVENYRISNTIIAKQVTLKKRI